VPLLLESKLPLDGGDQSFAEFLAVHRQDRLAAIEGDLDVGAFHGSERYTLFSSHRLNSLLFTYRL
jgi:hypothetical protein